MAGYPCCCQQSCGDYYCSHTFGAGDDLCITKCGFIYDAGIATFTGLAGCSPGEYVQYNTILRDSSHYRVSFNVAVTQTNLGISVGSTSFVSGGTYGGVTIGNSFSVEFGNCVNESGNVDWNYTKLDGQLVYIGTSVSPGNSILLNNPGALSLSSGDLVISNYNVQLFYRLNPLVTGAASASGCPTQNCCSVYDSSIPITISGVNNSLEGPPIVGMATGCGTECDLMDGTYFLSSATLPSCIDTADLGNLGCGGLCTPLGFNRECKYFEYDFGLDQTCPLSLYPESTYNCTGSVHVLGYDCPDNGAPLFEVPCTQYQNQCVKDYVEAVIAFENYTPGLNGVDTFIPLTKPADSLEDTFYSCMETICDCEVACLDDETDCDTICNDINNQCVIDCAGDPVCEIACSDAQTACYNDCDTIRETCVDGCGNNCVNGSCQTVKIGQLGIAIFYQDTSNGVIQRAVVIQKYDVDSGCAYAIGDISLDGDADSYVDLGGFPLMTHKAFCSIDSIIIDPLGEVYAL